MFVAEGLVVVERVDPVLIILQRCDVLVWR
jgi:hypothetical protein